MKKLMLLAILVMNTWTLFAQSKSFMFEQTKRKYLLYVPKSYDPGKAYPLVYNFHGGGMTATEQMFYTRMNDAAEKYKFILVYPSGIKGDWNIGFDMSYKNGTDDIGYIKALTDTLKKKYTIDNKAIFATGLSRGGFFCHRLAAEMPDVFAAVASIGGPLPDSVQFYNKSKLKIAVMQVQGTSDQVVDYHGKPGYYHSAVSTFKYWMAQNALSGLPVKKRRTAINKKDSTSVLIEEVSSKDFSVSLVSILNGGHTWPGSDPFNIGYPLGKTAALNINQVMWQFFDKNRKDKEK